MRDVEEIERLLVWKALRRGGMSVCLSEETYFQQTSEVASFGIKFTFASQKKTRSNFHITEMESSMTQSEVSFDFLFQEFNF